MGFFYSGGLDASRFYENSKSQILHKTNTPSYIILPFLLGCDEKILKYVWQLFSVFWNKKKLIPSTLCQSHGQFDTYL